MYPRRIRPRITAASAEAASTPASSDSTPGASSKLLKTACQQSLHRSLAVSGFNSLSLVEFRFGPECRALSHGALGSGSIQFSLRLAVGSFHGEM